METKRVRKQSEVCLTYSWENISVFAHITQGCGKKKTTEEKHILKDGKENDEEEEEGRRVGGRVRRMRRRCRMNRDQLGGILSMTYEVRKYGAGGKCKVINII